MLRLILFLGFIIGLFFGSVMELQAQENKKMSMDSPYNEWNFRVSPFFWYVGLKGEISIPPQPSLLPEVEPSYEIDIGFKELRHSLKFAIMMSGGYRNNRVVGRFNFFSLILESDAKTPLDYVFQNLNVKMYYFGGDLSAGYRFLKRPKVQMDAMLGVKLVSAKIAASTDVIGQYPIAGERHKIWWDPMVALRVHYYPWKRVEFYGYTDIGILLGHHTSYQSNTEVFYHINKWFYMSVGYRVWGLEVPYDEAIYNGIIYGWISRIGFQF